MPHLTSVPSLLHLACRRLSCAARARAPLRANPRPLCTSTPLLLRAMSSSASARGAASTMALPDSILITQLAVRMHVGVDGWERLQAQPVNIDARVHTDVSQAGRSDHLPHSIHYGILVKELEKHCAENRYRSLEALAEGLAKVCIFTCKAPRITLRVEKPRSLLHAHSAGVSIIRSADDYVSKSGASPRALFDAAGPPADRAETAALELVGEAGAEDTVFVRDLSISTILGVNPWERVDRQIVLFNLLVTPGARSKRSVGVTVDKVTRPQNYRTLVRAVTAYVERTNFKTVESLATAVARVAVLENGVERIRVRVDKPSAIMFAQAAGVEVDRDREFFEREAIEEARGPAQVPVPAPAAAVVDSVLSASHQTRIEQTATVAAPAPDVGAAATTSRPTAAPPADAPWHVVAIALGSNLGDRAAHIERAVQALASAPGCRLVDTSFLYESKPLYYEDQPLFLNGACRIATQLAPLELLALTQSIETSLGRDKRGVPVKGPRIVDLDIIFYDRLEFETPTLTLPHPGVAEREFVLRPLADILPHYRHPSSSRTVAQLLSILVNSEGYDGSGDIYRVLPLPVDASAAASGSTSTQWEWGRRTYVMGILNATPDSFSDGGDHAGVAEALAAAQRMVEQGADMLDVGGMSTAPQAVEVSAEEEAARVVPVIKALRSAGIETPISIDTFRASVARAALEAGATAVNDVSGGLRDPAILDVVREASCPYILMHMRGTSKTMSSAAHTTYAGGDVVGGVARELVQRVDAALRAGVRRWNIVLDPGVGFAKDAQGNVELLRHLNRLTAGGLNGALASTTAGSRATSVPPSPILGPSDADASPLSSLDAAQDAFAPHTALTSFPVLLGPSRKRFLGTITGKTEPKARVYATAAACAAGIAAGVDVLRVHDVEPMLDAARVSDAIFRAPLPLPKS